MHVYVFVCVGGSVLALGLTCGLVIMTNKSSVKNLMTGSLIIANLEARGKSKIILYMLESIVGYSPAY